jgi:hypothetical protein
LQETADDDFAVDPDNWNTVNLWLKVSHLWEIGPMGGFISLNWTSVLAKIQLQEKYEHLEITPEMLRGLEVMEHEALKVLNKKHK